MLFWWFKIKTNAILGNAQLTIMKSFHLMLVRFPVQTWVPAMGPRARNENSSESSPFLWNCCSRKRERNRRGQEKSKEILWERSGWIVPQFFKTGVQFLTLHCVSVCWTTKWSAISIHIYPPSWTFLLPPSPPSHPPRSPQSTKLSPLSCTVVPLSVYT